MEQLAQLAEERVQMADRLEGALIPNAVLNTQRKNLIKRKELNTEFFLLQVVYLSQLLLLVDFLLLVELLMLVDFL
jgi:hypothetical protein